MVRSLLGPLAVLLAFAAGLGLSVLVEIGFAEPPSPRARAEQALDAARAACPDLRSVTLRLDCADLPCLVHEPRGGASLAACPAWPWREGAVRREGSVTYVLSP